MQHSGAKKSSCLAPHRRLCLPLREVEVVPCYYEASRSQVVPDNDVPYIISYDGSTTTVHWLCSQ